MRKPQATPRAHKLLHTRFLNTHSGFVRFELEADQNNRSWLSIGQCDMDGTSDALILRDDEIATFAGLVLDCLFRVENQALPVSDDAPCDEAETSQAWSLSQLLQKARRPSVSSSADSPERTGTNYMEQQKAKHQRAYEAWSAEEDEELILKWREMPDLQELMEHFGRNRGAIRSRLKKLNLA